MKSAGMLFLGVTNFLYLERMNFKIRTRYGDTVFASLSIRFVDLPYQLALR